MTQGSVKAHTEREGADVADEQAGARRNRRNPPAKKEKTATVTRPTRPSARDRKAYLLVIAGPDTGQIIRLRTEAPLVIGRSKHADIVLSDDGVSRRHAKILVHEDRAILEDMKSHNGTFVGEQQVARRALMAEDLIRLGARTVLKFCVIHEVEEKYQKRLVSAAMRDPLTSVYNRRHLDERLEAECALSRRHGNTLSLLLLDLDDFKKINDVYGHPVGDSLLKELTKAMQDTVRKEDLIFRYGGEEFAVLARETDLPRALRLAERLRSKVSMIRMKLPAEFGPKPLRATVSVGVAEFVPDMDDATLIEAADTALYKAKRAGKNTVIAAAS